MEYGSECEFRWTIAYCGIQHLNATVPGVRQITAEDHGTFAEVWALGLQGFTPFWKVQFNTIEEARQAGEKKARELSH